MPEIATTPDAPAEAEAPAVILTPQDATAEHIARGLSPEQAKAFRANRKEKKAKAAAAAAAPSSISHPPSSPADDKPAETPATETITFNPDETAPAEQVEESTTAELSDDELAKLDEKARKRITEASKEAWRSKKSGVLAR